MPARPVQKGGADEQHSWWAGMIPYDRRAWVRLLFSPRGNLASAVGGKVLAFGALAVIVWAADRLFEFPVRLPVGFHEVAGIVIGLILAFRTNTAYSRFWEGRTLWGGIVNASRNLSRVVTGHGGLNAGEARELCVWIACFAHATRCRLRGLLEIVEVKSLLPPEDYRRLVTAPHPPLHCAGELTERITALAERRSLSEMMATLAEKQVISLVDCLGGCEKILRTPTPLAYVLLIERGVFLYLGTLPAGLLGRLGWLTPIVVMGVAYLVLMIETIGNELDNPFGTDAADIPLDHICADLTFNLLGVGEPPEVILQKGVGPVET
jgi:putative membrane protein